MLTASQQFKHSSQKMQKNSAIIHTTNNYYLRIKKNQHFLISFFTPEVVFIFKKNSNLIDFVAKLHFLWNFCLFVSGVILQLKKNKKSWKRVKTDGWTDDGWQHKAKVFGVLNFTQQKILFCVQYCVAPKGILLNLLSFNFTREDKKKSIFSVKLKFQDSIANCRTRSLLIMM